MNIKKSIVKDVQAAGTFNSQKYGLFYKYEVSFENGDSGEYSSKSEQQNKFIKGQEAYYTAEKNQYGFYKIKPQSAEYAQNNASNQISNASVSSATNFTRDELIVRQNALGHAVQLFQGGALSVEDIEDRADQFATWVLKGESKQDKLNKLDQAGFSKDDLPF